jgi:hypothetical protein
MASYRARFPQADTLLLEPDRHDERFFFTNVFRYAERRRLVHYAYQRARRDLLAQAAQLAPVLKRHGLELNTEVLRERRRSFATAGKERRLRAQHTAHRLDRALGRLESMLARSHV